MSLFDVHHLVKYGIHVYGPRVATPRFASASSLYHPNVVIESQAHDGSGNLPGFKDENNNWDLRPHRDRIMTVDDEMLKVWHSVLESNDVPLYETRMVYTVNSAASDVLAKLAAMPRVRELELQFSGGWNETTDKRKGYFDVGWGHPKSWEDVIFQGPHLGVSTPMIKQPNPTMKHNQDWTEVDLEALPDDFIPATAYQPNRTDKNDYDIAYGTWDFNGEPVPVASQYRIAWRRMAATTGFRTFYPAIIPPGAKHVNPVHSAGSPRCAKSVVAFGAVGSSVLTDFFLRSTGTADIFASTVLSFPITLGVGLQSEIFKEYLRLNCLTEEFAPLWEAITGGSWTPLTAYRREHERALAQARIDVHVAQSFGVDVDELCMIYRTQFPVMRRYDMEDRYDANGRKVPKDVMKLEKGLKDGKQLSEAERTWTHPQSGVEYVFEYPFEPFDREAAYRDAYAELEKEVAE